MAIDSIERTADLIDVEERARRHVGGGRAHFVERWRERIRKRRVDRQ